ncbi:MAG: hypothetical protein ACFCBU_01795 [Cyanophyceae cyanobacterium]
MPLEARFWDHTDEPNDFACLTMPRRRTKFPKPRPCDRCQTPSLVRYRIQYDDSQDWWLGRVIN